MNKIHRTVWNQARQSFVVVAETARTHGKPASRTTVASAVAAALLAIASGQAAAACSTTTVISSSIVGPYSLGAAECIDVQAPNGVISGGSTGIKTTTNPTAGAITNSGTIIGSYVGIAISDSIVDGGITNSGTIAGGTTGILVESTSTISGGIVNQGTIAGGTTGIHVEYYTDVTGGVTNSGTIAGASANGIYASYAVTIGGIVNNSSGVISGGNAGIYLDYSSTVTGGITNSGLIQGDVNGIYSNDSTINGDIVNTPTGVIRGGTDIFQGGIYLDRTSVLSGRILNQGLIEGGEGGVVADDYSHIEQGVTNTGMISGAIAGINVLSFSTISGGIVNQGTIAGGSDGIRIVSYSAVTGGITNSGTISGGNYSIYVDDETASLDSISITGNDTAKFIGEVYAPNTPVTVVAGHSYTMDDGNLFTVQSFTNAGTLKIGAGNTGTITGDFINTGTFRPTVANTAYGKLVVNGNATLGGSLFVDASTLTAGHSYTNGTVSGVITASTTVSGTFASYDDNSLLFNLTPSYGSNQLDLVISAAGTTGVYDAVVAQGNRPATGAARVLDDIIAGDGQIAGLFLSVSASQAKISDAASQTLPLLTGGAQQAAHAAINSINRVVQARIESNLGLSSGNDFLGNKRVWLKPFGSWVEQDNRNGVAGYDARIMGFALGADAVVSPATRVGLAFAYARADVNGKSSVAPTSADVDAYRLIGYGSYGLDENTEVNLQAGFGMNQNDGRRNLTAFVPTSVARSDYDSLTATVGVGLGRIYKFSEQTRFIPSIRADYTWVKDKGYTETGPSLLNLSVRSATSEEMIVAVDGKLMHEISQGTTLAANLGLGYDFLSDQASITSAFAGYPGATFVTNGIDPSPWVVRGGLGFTRMVRNDMEVTARYDAEHRKDFLNQTASVKLRWSF